VAPSHVLHLLLLLLAAPAAAAVLASRLLLPLHQKGLCQVWVLSELQQRVPHGEGRGCGWPTQKGLLLLHQQHVVAVKQPPPGMRIAGTLDHCWRLRVQQLQWLQLLRDPVGCYCGV
jgi:hypothetical protein